MNTREILVFSISTIFTAIISVIIAGLLTLFVKNPSFNSAVGLAIGIGIALPVKFIYLNIENLDEKIIERIDEDRLPILISTLLFIPSYIAFSQGIGYPGAVVLNISFHASAQAFLPLKIMFAGYLGDRLADLLFTFTRQYLHFLWIYLISYSSIPPVRNALHRIRKRDFQ